MNIQYRTIIKDSNDPGYVNRIMIATPVTGLLRVEWVNARYGQIIPVNWSSVQMIEWMDTCLVQRYQVADAQNLIVKEFIEREFEWLFLLEHDVVLPPDGFIKLNEWMRKAVYPVVSGLYYTRSAPAEPLIFRGRGVGAFYDWDMGDVVYCDGVPTGCLLIHKSILKVMWDESADYFVRGTKTRRVFDTPRALWFSPDDAQTNTISGTSDLDWCTKIINNDVIKRAGWTFEEEWDEKNPFIVDTSIFCRHQDIGTGQMFP